MQRKESSTNNNNNNNDNVSINNSVNKRAINVKNTESKLKSSNATGGIIRPNTSDTKKVSDLEKNTTISSNSNNNANNTSNSVEHSLASELQSNAHVTDVNIGNDVLCINVRFLRTILAQCITQPSIVSETVLMCYNIPSKTVSRDFITNMCRQLTVERDIFGPLLQAYRATGGIRHNTVFHSAVLSVFDLISRLQPPSEEPSKNVENSIIDIRNFLVFRY